MGKVDDSFISDEMLTLWRKLMALEKAAPGRAHHDREYFDLSTELRLMLGLRPWQWGPHEVDCREDDHDDGRAWRLRLAFQRAARRRA